MQKAIRSGEIKLNGLTIKCHVLEDGKRIIEEQSLYDFMEYMSSGKLNEEDAVKIAKELKSL